MYNKFRQLITKRNITPYRIAKDTGLSQATLSYWKSGRSIPKADKLQKIAKYLGVTLEELMEEEEN